MKHRTRQFALRVIRLVESLPKGRTEDVLGKQLLRSGTSVGANYRAACRNPKCKVSLDRNFIYIDETIRRISQCSTHYIHSHEIQGRCDRKLKWKN